MYKDAVKSYVKVFNIKCAHWIRLLLLMYAHINSTNLNNIIGFFCYKALPVHLLEELTSAAKETIWK